MFLHARLICSDRTLNCIGDSSGLLVNLVEFLALDEQTNFWFRAGIAQKNPTFASEFAFDFISYFYDFAQFLDRRFFFFFFISLRLRVFFLAGFLFCLLLGGFVRDSQQLLGAYYV